jgi:Flp pilus assembly protein TadD
MIATVFIAAGVATAIPVQTVPTHAASLADAAHAISAGRLDQGRLIVARAIATGATGPAVERLLADLAFASGNDAEALARYRRLLMTDAKDPSICERAGVAALRTDRLEEAKVMLGCATALPGASWHSWNARGVLADLERDWPAADMAYALADRLAPAEARVINNQGFSHLLRGDWASAVNYFERAAALDPSSGRITNNLELARSALAVDLPRRRHGESDQNWAERLNDAGVLAQILGDRSRAVAAFTQALTASGHWYVRAANNLEAATGK